MGKDRESERILSYVGETSGHSWLEDPLPRLSQFLLDNFGYPLSAGRVRARRIILELAQLGLLDYELGKWNTVQRVRLKDCGAEVSERESTIVADIPERVALPEKDEEMTGNGNQPDLWGKRPAGKRKHKRLSMYKIADRDEKRFYKIMEEFLALLRERFPDVVLDASCSRSGRHNPAEGKIDLRDHAGDDVAILLTVKDGAGTIRAGKLIYDVKHSAESSRMRNADIIRFPGQEDALLKRAITVNKKRSTTAIRKEVVGAMVEVGLLPEEIAREF
jgi:hypothetical protein